MAKKLTNLEIRKRQIEQALPAVKKVVRQHGLSIVNSCISRLKEYEKTLRELEGAKEEVARLERETKTN